MGGEGPKAIECAAEVCDGWAPWNLEWSKAKEAIIELRRLSVANGRDPNSLEVSVFELSIPNEQTIAEMETVGVKRIILTVFAQGREGALRNLDLLAERSRS
jgi:hypothetical protein